MMCDRRPYPCASFHDVFTTTGSSQLVGASIGFSIGIHHTKAWASSISPHGNASYSQNEG